MLSLSLDEPLMKILTGLEHVLKKAQVLYHMCGLMVVVIVTSRTGRHMLVQDCHFQYNYSHSLPSS